MMTRNLFILLGAFVLALFFAVLPARASFLQRNEKGQLVGRVIQQVCVGVTCSTSGMRNQEVLLCPAAHGSIVQGRSGASVRCDSGFLQTVRTGRGGEFVTRLTVGQYIVDMSLAIPLSSANIPTTVTIQKNHVVNLKIVVDSGAR